MLRGYKEREGIIMKNKELIAAKSLVTSATCSIMSARALEIAKASDSEAVKNAIDEHIHSESIRFMEMFEGKRAEEIICLSVLEIAKAEEGLNAMKEVITGGYHKRD